MQILLKCTEKQGEDIISHLEEVGVDNFITLNTPEDFVEYYSTSREYKSINK